jgi:cleavage and polyadenylation specificity factor subunit 1
MHALRTELLPPSGVEYVTSLSLTPACLSNVAAEANSSSSIRSDSKTTVLCNLVVARSNLLRIFEVREEPAPPPSEEADAARERNEKVRTGTEAIEGEVEMDEHLEGYVTMGGVKVITEYIRVFCAFATVIIDLSTF